MASNKLDSGYVILHLPTGKQLDDLLASNAHAQDGYWSYAPKLEQLIKSAPYAQGKKVVAECQEWEQTFVHWSLRPSRRGIDFVPIVRYSAELFEAQPDCARALTYSQVLPWLSGSGKKDLQSFMRSMQEPGAWANDSE
ncbi:hypothetical protein [Acidithiobacillus sp. AMEEHan]|uniref:hypothetical protein n=1 Tax=Acidithiobacillus sp. AMEEHan TaxID=2994951 RepID=UPI0027E57574|nr:hypothetical protein [Acidithiobacillus sp. AMEEHan]